MKILYLLTLLFISFNAKSNFLSISLSTNSDDSFIQEIPLEILPFNNEKFYFDEQEEYLLKLQRIPGLLDSDILNFKIIDKAKEQTVCNGAIHTPCINRALPYLKVICKNQNKTLNFRVRNRAFWAETDSFSSNPYLFKKSPTKETKNLEISIISRKDIVPLIFEYNNDILYFNYEHESYIVNLYVTPGIKETEILSLNIKKDNDSICEVMLYTKGFVKDILNFNINCNDSKNNKYFEMSILNSTFQNQWKSTKIQRVIENFKRD